MIYLLYNSLVFLLLPFSLPILALLLLRKKYRTGLVNRLGIVAPVPEKYRKGKVIWFHAVSVGEVLASMPLIRLYRQRFPDAFLLLSTVTVTGNMTAKSKIPEIDSLVFFPFDFIWSVRNSINTIRPDIFIFFETEIWPNFINTLKKNKVPAILVNGRLSRKSFDSYRRLGFLWRRVLDDISFFSVQTEHARDLFARLGVPDGKLAVTGNMKYEQVMTNSGSPPDFFRKFRHESIETIFLAGSTHDGEEEIILDAMIELKKRGVKIYPVIAPRHLERIPKIETLITEKGLKSIRRSSLSDTSLLANHDIMLLDTMGELTNAYGGATLVFIGGSLVPVGGHNILEAAVCEKMVMFGPYMSNIADISEEFINREAAVMVKDSSDMVQSIMCLLDDRKKLDRMGKNGREIVLENQSAVPGNVEILERFF